MRNKSKLSNGKSKKHQNKPRSQSNRKPKNRRRQTSNDYSPYDDEKQCVRPHQSHRHHQHQQQQQAFQHVDKQAQIVARAQLLLGDVGIALELTNNYMAALRKGCSKKEAQSLNQRVVAALVCLDMKVGGMRSNAANEGISFNGAFKAGKLQIRQFEQSAGAQLKKHPACAKRLPAVLNYMRAVLDGRKVPDLPYIKHYEADADVCNSVMGSFANAMQTVIPGKLKQFAQHSGTHKKKQKAMEKQYDAQEVGEDERVRPIDHRDLVQDYQSEYTFAKSKRQQKAEKEAELKAKRFQEPNLMEMDDSDEDYF